MFKKLLGIASMVLPDKWVNINPDRASHVWRTHIGLGWKAFV